MTRTPLALLIVAMCGVGGTVSATRETFQIGIIDFYGLRSVSAADARAALAFKEGDAIELADKMPPVFRASEARLTKISGVVRARVNPVCCDNGHLMVYVGVEERGAPTLQFRPAPDGAARLPADVVQAGQKFSKAFVAAVERGDAAEDRSQGHSLLRDPATRAIQEQFIVFAAGDLAVLRRVLAESSDADQRALAAQVLGYAPDKQAVVNDLVDAMSDQDSNVRNAAMRALMVFAEASTSPNRLHVRVPAAPFIAFLNSLVWTDRNKASLALMSLSASRDSEVLSDLRASALEPLVEMARWKNAGHAIPAFMILARLGGYTDEAGQALWDQGRREVVIEAARRAR